MTERKTLSFNREPKSVRAARGALADLDADFPHARLYDASLCLSELVTNAVQHGGGGGELQLTVALDDERLRVEVADEGTGFNPGQPSEGDERGWGLFIVKQLSDRWGVEPGDPTVVWFEIVRQGRARMSSEGDVEAPGSRDERDDRLLRAASLRLKGRLATP